MRHKQDCKRGNEKDTLESVEPPSPKIENQGLFTASRHVVEWLKFILVLLIVIEVFLTCINIVGSFDFPWQLAEGDFILDHGHPTKSVLEAYGEVSPQFQNEYIAYEVLIAGINRYTGWTGLCIFFGLLGFSIYLPVLIAFLKSRHRFALIDICLFMLAQFLINMRLAARPELVADVCYVLAGIMLMRWPGKSWSMRQTLVFGLIFCLWSNAHGTFLLGGAMLALWYAQLFLFEWRTLLFTKDFTWLRPGLAAAIGCAINPFGFYRYIQPFELHSLVWGQGTSLEMGPVTSGVALLPLTWTTAAVLALVMRVRERKFYWMIAMLFLLQYLTFISIRYNMFIGLTLLVVTWDGLMHPREPFSPPIFPLAFATARLGLYLYLVVAYSCLCYSILGTKLDMLEDYTQFVYPKSKITTTSSFGWLREHPTQEYYLLSNLAAGSWSQMPATKGIHALIDSGSHRYSDRTNQLYYYSLFSPDIFRQIIAKLNVNAITINSANIYWASILNANPDWQLVHIKTDSQLYLRKSNLTAKAAPPLFSEWEANEEQKEAKDRKAGDPITVPSERILRGLKLRPDSDSLKMLSMASDVVWLEDPQVVYVQEWLDQVPDNLVEEKLNQMGNEMDNSSAGLRILLLLRLRQDQRAADIARQWHPMLLDMGSQDLQMLRAEAFVRAGDTGEARKILDSFWPKPRYSLRWARLCEQVYANDPGSMPPNARLLTGKADESQWLEDTLTTLNQNISRFSTSTSRSTP
jgi:hypothetical protein